MISVRGIPVWVGGVPDTMRTGLPDEPNAKAAARGGEKALLRVLLSHRPDLAPAASGAGFHLQLSGHTHGGQFFPWTLVARLGTTPEISALTVGFSP
jgi:uncharacterized protein